MKTFAELQLIEPLCRVLSAEKYTVPTPIQAQAIPCLLDGHDLLGCAQTGTGKTASFALPVLQKITELDKPVEKNNVRALVLTPTRELALQVSQSFKTYGRHTKTSCTVVYGGVGYGPQIAALRKGVDVLVATPGRLIDLLNSDRVRLSNVQFLILDEADRMLDMGFKKDIEKIVSEVREDRQTILFSATMPKTIEKFANAILNNPKRIDVSPKNITAQNVKEEVIFLKKEDKNEALYGLLRNHEIERAIVFTRTKHIADRLAKKLKSEEIACEAIHGNKTQGQRQKSLNKFKKGSVNVLVATDVAARGIDIDNVSHVINYQLSNEAESYVHRIGRTGRAGNLGKAITLCDYEDGEFLLAIEKLIKRKLEITKDSEFHDEPTASKHLQKSQPKKKDANSDRRKRPDDRNSRRRRRPNRQRRRVRAAA